MKRLILLAALLVGATSPAFAQTPTPVPHQASRMTAAFKQWSMVADPANCATVTRCSVTLDLLGVQPGDLITVDMPTSNWNDDLILLGAQIETNNEVKVYFYNPTGGGINNASVTFTGLWWDRTDRRESSYAVTPKATATPTQTPTPTPTS